MNNLQKFNPQVADLTRYSSPEEYSAKLAGKAVLTKKAHASKGGKDYVPIDAIEKSLDEVYTPGGWQVTDLQVQSLGATSQGKGFICVSLVLQVLDPITHQWISRAGVASEAISEKQASMMIAAQKSRALTNAARSLGELFGRSLARNEQDKADAEVTTMAKRDIFDNVKSQLATFETVEEVEAFRRSTPFAREFKAMIDARVSYLQITQNGS